MRFPVPRLFPRPRRGFTIIELMLAVALMTVIIFGLYTVFDQTQRALRQTMAQVDVMEGVRATTDLLARDLEAAAPVELADLDNTRTSFAAFASPLSVPVDLKGLSETGDTLLRTALQDIYLVNRRNDQWTAIGYWVGPISSNQFGQPISLGRLYRFQYQTNTANFAYTNLFERFNSPLRLETSQPVIDGVIHLRLIAYDVLGRPMVHQLTNNIPALHPWFPDPNQNVETAYWFRSRTRPSFPSAIELEIGVMEPQLVIRYNAIPDAAEARRFLARNSGKIHLFRQRIPLRNAPPF